MNMSGKQRILIHTTQNNNCMSKWPNYTCALSFVYHSFTRIGYKITIQNIAKHLSIIIPRSEPNPYGFCTTDNEVNLGYDQSFAEKEINNLLRDYSHNYNFRLILLSHIPYQQYDYLIKDLLASNIIVGIGYNYSRIYNTSSTSLSKHISFIDSIDNQNVNLLDFYIKEAGEKFMISYDTLIKASLDIKGSLWVLGQTDSINEILKQYGINYGRN